MRFLVFPLLTLLATQALALDGGWRFRLEAHQKGLANPTGFFAQKLHHDRVDDTTTFNQRYFVDSRHAEGENSPVFYLICGEWTCAGTSSYSAIGQLAREAKAHLVALEHRYYGQSLPFSRLSTENLQPLSLAAALADLAAFQRHAMETMNLKGKWVAVGGSYAGTLAAFYRLKHPELVVGALASSAPVLVKAEFNEYDAHVANVIKGACVDKVREAVALIEQRLATPEGADAVKAQFRASEIRDNDDFLYVVADMLAAAVQYGSRTSFCQTLTTASDLVDGYARAGLAALGRLGMNPLGISMQAAEPEEAAPGGYFRQWMWQSCREFGWFQVANAGEEGTSRSSRIDLAYHDRVCERLFGVPQTADGSLNAEYYGPLFDPTTTKIIFTNGSDDPWLRLSVVPSTLEETPNPGLGVLVMEGAAHCDDLRAFQTLPSVIAAQASFGATIKSWLGAD